jgi:hypothetical protein
VTEDKPEGRTIDIKTEKVSEGFSRNVLSAHKAKILHSFVARERGCPM